MFGTGMYKSRYHKYPYRLGVSRYRHKRKALTKPAKKEVAVIAKKVHYRNTERKWKGFALTTNLQPNTGDVNSSVDIHNVLGVNKGDDSSEREGRRIQSQSLELNLFVNNTYILPFHMRVLCLRAKQNSIVPLPANILIDTVTKAPKLLTQFGSDAMRKVSNELWTVLYDKTHYIWPQGRDTAGATEGEEIGRSKYSQIFKCKVKTNIRLDYELALVNLTNVPVKNNTYWVVMFGFGEDNTPPPVTTDPIQNIRFTRQSYHYFKDV